ncbi:MAG TPA: NusG domain II-containing protein [Lachnospiraceae bacterium]|nr:NusG domain II-containing protein [Lachnospiraceae bacterium]
MIKKKDLILAGVILVIALLAMLFIVLTKEEGGEVVITVDGEVYKTLPLDKDITLTIGGESGDYNVLQIKEGKVSMTDANCPDKYCVKHRDIHYNHESIICLPHKVIVEIQGGDKNDVDTITN